MKSLTEAAYISVDVETAGPYPGGYALLSIGACLVSDPDQGFYVELSPDREGMDPEAIAVSGLDPTRLRVEGTAPDAAMQSFMHWLDDVTPQDQQPIFVAFNAAFDWMFISDYFHRYQGFNPFGHRALDIKAMYMGVFGAPWQETSMNAVTKRLGLSIQLSHNALEDAVAQASIFTTLLEFILSGNEGER